MLWQSAFSEKTFHVERSVGKIFWESVWIMLSSVSNMTAVSSRRLPPSFPAWPGWNAETGSGRLSIVRVNHAFVGFRLEPGRHEVRLHYRPPLLGPALGGCLAGVLLVAVLSVFTAIRAATHVRS
jgi:hypothetical protein